MAPPPSAVMTLDEIINTNDEHPSDQGRQPIKRICIAAGDTGS
jgi:hypothetical protein